jgi:hypothetical protein
MKRTRVRKWWEYSPLEAECDVPDWFADAKIIDYKVRGERLVTGEIRYTHMFVLVTQDEVDE